MEKYKKAEIEYENKIAKNYNEWYHSTPIMKAHVETFARFVRKNLKKGDKVLDLGCGPASLWPYWQKIIGVEFIGVDVSPKMISVAKKYFPRGKFQVADSEKLPFLNKEFDAVICSSVLHHLPKTDQTLKEIKRILKPYGKLIGREPQKDQFFQETDPYLSGAVTHFMHFLFRKTKIQPHREPPIHKYHHAYKINEFVQTINKYLVIHDIQSKFPFSYLFYEIKSAFYGRIILATDRFLDNYKGNQFFYLALKDGSGKTEILSYINSYLNNLNSNGPPLKFVRRLIKLTAFLNLILPKK